MSVNELRTRNKDQFSFPDGLRVSGLSVHDFTEEIQKAKQYADNSKEFADQSAASLGLLSDEVQRAAVEADRSRTNANEAAQEAIKAARSASTAINAPGTNATSTTQLSLSVGNKTLSVQSGKLFVTGQFIVIADTQTPSRYLTGQVIAYNPNTGELQTSITAVSEESELSALQWTISITAPGVFINGSVKNNDPRLSDARPPTAHIHYWSDIRNFPTSLSGYGITDATPASHIGSFGSAHAIATELDNGFLSAADKRKLNGIEESANKYVHPITDGSLHVPATGTTSQGKVLTAGATVGSMSWVTPLQLTNTPAFAPTSASAGVASTAARADHVHPAQVDVTGSAGKLNTARKISVSGDANGNVNFDGSADVTINLALANTGITAGVYNNSTTSVTPFTLDSKGRVASIGVPVKITPAWNSITNLPTTLSGYGITDAQPLLVSGVNIKRINGVSILGEGDITIDGGSSAPVVYQTSKIVLSRLTIGAVTEVLTTDESTPNATNQLILPDDSSYFFSILIVARRADADNESAGYKFEGVVERNAGASTVNIVGSTQTSVWNKTSNNWNCEIVTDNINGGISIRATGETNKSIRWKATVWTTEVSA